MVKYLGAGLVAGFLVIAAQAQAATVFFDFNSLLSVAGTPFSLTSGGLTATLTAPGDPGGFQVGKPAVFSFPDQTLFTPGLSGQLGQTLAIAFDQPVTSFVGVFATNGAGPLSLTAYLGAAAAGGSSAVGTVPGGYYFPEGSISFGGASFDKVILADRTDMYFAFGSFKVTTGVPEPATWAMLLVGFAGLGIAGLEASRKRAAVA